MNQLIEQFESLPEQNVKAFNELFKNSPLVGLQDDLEVTIGALSPLGRKIFVNEEVYYLDVVSQVAESCKNANLRKLKTENVKLVKQEKKPLELTKEFSLSGNAFKLLYLLKNKGTLENVLEISRALKVSPVTVKTALIELQKEEYIKVYTIGNILKITLAENNNL